MIRAAIHWRSVDETMPIDGKPVLVVAQNDRRQYWARALYVPKRWGTWDGLGEYAGEMDYDESTDESYWPEGWYEWNHDTGINYAMGDPVVCWAYVPMPKGVTNDD